MPQLSNYPNFTDLGVTNYASGVLLKSNMPASIQESVFISNSQECNALKQGTRRTEIVNALFTGLENWFSGSHVGGEGSDNPGHKCSTPPCGKNK